MHRRLTSLSALLAVALVLTYLVVAKVASRTGSGFVANASGAVTEGSLRMLNPEGQIAGLCPLKHTDVKAEISGFIARVVVTQDFENPFKEKIEAVYTFPLPQNAAVDDMTMRIGERTVRGQIKRREEARAVYEAARAAGHVASLLDQERPNIFTQSVANIMPGEKVRVTISYVETLKYEDGSYEFVFPMVVGPRYIPGAPTGKQGGGWAPDTDRVPDASRITPPVTPEGARAGHDISLEVALDAGVPLDSIKSPLHEIEVDRPTDHSAIVQLKDRAVIPNKDFIFKYDVAGRRVEDALLTHRSKSGGFFTFILQPPERVTAEDVTPKEIVFVIDTSGSMSGFPIEKAKEAMKLALDGLYPQDTFNLITFAGDTHVLFPEPVPATSENLSKAQAFLRSRSGSGGTEMMKAIRAALEPSDRQDHIRIVCFMTDGYVGNDLEIISEIQRHQNARVFSFGVGNSVNRFLLDKMAEHGRGEVEYVTLSDDGSAAARRFHERVRSPLLTDISIDWAGLQVEDIYPKRIPDLFSAKPVILSGRYTTGGNGVIKLKGKMAGLAFEREIAVSLPEREPRRNVLASLWARARIDDLMSQDYRGMQYASPREDIRETITQLGLEFKLMTQFTSFVAVEEMIVTDGGQPRRIEVPVEMPEGVSYDGVFGNKKDVDITMKVRSQAQAKRSSNYSIGGGAGGGAGSGAGRGSSGPDRKSKPSPPAGVAEVVTVTGEPKIEMTRDEIKAQRLLSKLHPAIAALARRLKDKNAKPAPEEARFVRNGKAEIQVWLKDKSKATIARLKKLGFELILDPKSATLIIGRAPVEKLAAIAELEEVLYISPVQ